MKQLWTFLYIGCGLLLLVAARPPANFVGESELELWESVNKTCLGSECNEDINLQHLRQLERYMEPSADPCENFYAYACGNWARVHANGTNTMQLADERLTANYLQLFERLLPEKRRRTLGVRAIQRVNYSQIPPPPPPLELPDVSDELMQKLLHYYVVCKDSELQGPLNLQGYMQELRARGLWRRENFNWLEALAQLARYGYTSHFLQMEVKQQNATQHLLRVMPHERRTRIQLNADVYAVLGEYTELSREALESAFHELDGELEQILSVACVGLPRDEDDDCELSQVLNFGELQTRAGEIDWQLYLSTQLRRALRKDDLVLVEDLASIKKIAQHLQRTDTQLLFLYTLAHFLQHLQQQPHAILSQGASGFNCLRHMRKLFYLPMAYVYERAYYARVRPESDAVITSVFTQLRAQFERTLRRNKMQLSQDALQYLLQKLHAMRLNIGNLPLNVSASFYQALLSELNLSTNYYRNHLHALQHAYAQQRALFELPTAVGSSPYHSVSYHGPHFPDNIDATAYYFCLNNMIVVPHAYLQLPFYDRRFWPALIYGDLANTLGHEMMHAFDTNFLPYDHAGNLLNVYRSVDASPLYSRNLRCVSEGTDYVCERIADISGTRLALDTFLADQQFLQANGKLYFLQFAQFFCNAQLAHEFHTHDPIHDLGSKRLNDTLAQMPEFALVFKCPVGSSMSPTAKCEMW